MDLYDKIFDKSKREKKLLLFELYGGNLTFCGNVLSWNHQAVQIEHFTNVGTSDGVIHIPYSSIYYIVTDSEYLNSLQLVINNQNSFREVKNSVIPLNTSTDWLPQVLKEYQNDESVILNIKISDSWYFGFAREIDEQFFSYTEINRNGEVLDNTIYRISDVSSIHINEFEGRRRLFLYNWRKNNSSDKK